MKHLVMINIYFEMNFIFEGIPAMKAMNNGWVLLLEEDHYVSPDFLHVLRMIVDKKERLVAMISIEMIIIMFQFVQSLSSDNTWILSEAVWVIWCKRE